ncbi:MAG: response regulator [Candidatus Neomarinimicrobiota bacterium]
MQRVILVADDSSTVRKFVSFSLKLHEYEVVTAVDGMDALEKMSQTKIDLAIVDLNMPNMDGFELINAIRSSEDYDKLPVLILSSERGEESKARAREVGANAYLVKPFDAKMLQYQVVKFLND